MYTTGTTLLAGLALLGSGVSAVCTGWEQGDIEKNAGHNSGFGIPLQTLFCEETEANKTCLFDVKSYNITAKRYLFEIDSGKVVAQLDLPEDEAEAIFKLAQEGYLSKEDHGDASQGKRDFIERKTTVSTGEIKPDTDGEYFILEVDPGYNATLYFVPTHQTSSGILSGCSNETLNGMAVQAMSSFIVDKTRVEGAWFSDGSKDEPVDNDDDANAGDDTPAAPTGGEDENGDDPESGVGRNAVGSAVYGLLAAGMGFVFIF